MLEGKIPGASPKGPDYRLSAETQGFPTPESFSFPEKIKREKKADANSQSALEKHAMAGSIIKEVFHSLGNGLNPAIAATLANVGCASPALLEEVMRLGAALGGGESQNRAGGATSQSMKTPNEIFSHAVLKKGGGSDNISSLSLIFPLAIALALQEKGYKPTVSPPTKKIINSVINSLKTPPKTMAVIDGLLKRLPPK